MKLSVRMFLMFLPVFVSDQLVDGQNGCFIIYPKSKQLGRHSSQAVHLYCIPYKRELNGDIDRKISFLMRHCVSVTTGGNSNTVTNRCRSASCIG